MSLDSKMKNKVNTIVANVFNVAIDDINKDSSPATVGDWDSLGQLSLIQSIELKFNITMEINEIFSILKVEDIYNILQKRDIS